MSVKTAFYPELLMGYKSLGTTLLYSPVATQVQRSIERSVKLMLPTVQVMSPLMRMAEQQVRLFENYQKTIQDNTVIVHKVLAKYEEKAIEQCNRDGRSPVLNMAIEMLASFDDIEAPSWVSRAALIKAQMEQSQSVKPKKGQHGSLRRQTESLIIDCKTYFLYDLLIYLRKTKEIKITGDSDHILGKFLNCTGPTVKIRRHRASKIIMKPATNEDYFAFRVPTDGLFQHLNVKR